MKFVIAEGLIVSTAAGEIRGPRNVQSLPAQTTVPVMVREGADSWSCQVHVGEGPSVVEVRSLADGKCVQR